jgi:phytoene synthase
VSAPRETLDDAYARCTRQAREHYENFPVGSWLLPRRWRKHIHAVYAFARTADDLADETVDTLSVPERLALLARWRNDLHAALRGETDHPVFAAVKRSIEECHLPVMLFDDLVNAFEQDVLKTRYATFAEVLDYCRRSANPVGRLVLLITGERDEAWHRKSDLICTALQLANFWQDVSVDAKKDRIYFPRESLTRFGVTEAEVLSGTWSDRARGLVAFEVERTRGMFHEGAPLTKYLKGRLAWEIELTRRGGLAILDKVAALDFNSFQTRPKLAKSDFVRLFVAMVRGR